MSDSSNKENYIFNGDIVSLCCQNESGNLLYSTPLSYCTSDQSDELSISSKENENLNPNIVMELAMFCITHGSKPNDEHQQLDIKKEANFDWHETDELSFDLMKIVYGSTVKLQHQASGKYLSVNKEEQICLTKMGPEGEHLFRIIPPGHHEKGWGKHLRDSDLIKLESVTHRFQKINFHRKDINKKLQDGTVFSIQSHCQKHMKLNPLSVKAGSVVMLASQKVDGYVSIKGLRRWQRGFFNIIPFSGDTFLQLVKVSNDSVGVINSQEPLFYGDQCRINLFLTKEQLLKTKDFKTPFQIRAADGYIPVNKEVLANDVITLATDTACSIHDIKFLSVKVTKGSVDTSNETSYAMSDDMLELSLEIHSAMSHFKVLKVEENAIMDLNYVMCLTLALCKCNEMLNEENVASIVNLMNRLKDSFELTEDKTRLANMLRNAKLIDVIVDVLEKLAENDDKQSQEACTIICLCLQMYIDYGTMKSIHYLSAKKKIIQTMVDKKFGQKVLLSLHYKDYRVTNELIEVQKLNTEDLDFAYFISIFALNGKKINRLILDKVCEQALKYVNHEVKEVVEMFLASSELLETKGIASSRLSKVFNLKYDSGFNSFTKNLKSDIDVIKTKITSLLSSNEGHSNANMLILSILAFMIDYGSYAEVEEVKSIALILKNILKSNRLIDNKGNEKEKERIVSKINTLALLSLQLLLKRQIHTSIKTLLFNYKSSTCSDASVVTQKHPRSVRYERFVDETDGLEGDTDGLTLEGVTVQDESDTSDFNKRKFTKRAVQAQLRKNFNTNVLAVFDASTEECQGLCNVLTNLISCSDFDVSLMSAELLFDLHNIERIMLWDAKEEVFVYSDAQAEEQSIDREMTKLATMTDNDQLLFKLTKKQLDKDGASKLKTKLDCFSRSCIMDESETVPNPTMQAVAYSCGLFDVTLDYVFGQGLSDYKDYKMILNNCFTFLLRVARKNKRAQHKLFISFYDFLKVKTAVQPMICLLNEVFLDNPDLCSKLTETDIENVFIAAIASSNTEYYELTVTLRVIIDNTSPATALQEYIAKLILRYSTDILGHLLDRKNPYYFDKIRLLEKSKDDDTNLYLLLNITDLIASCTRNCHYAESVSCQLYPLQELLDILFYEKIATHRKLPFIRVLNSTHLETKRDSAQTCKNLALNKEFWKYNQIIVQKTLHETKMLKKEEKEALENNLKKRNEFYLSIHQLTEHDGNLTTEVDQNLLYIIEGLIPLLIAFYSSGRSSGVIKADQIFVDEIKGFIDPQIPFVTGKVKEFEACINQTDFQSHINHYQPDRSKMSSHDSFQTYIQKCIEVYTEDISSDEMQRSLLIPANPSFIKLIDEFTDKDNDLMKNEILSLKSLKATKLLLLLQSLIQKQKPLGLRRINLEEMTLTTLKLLCGIVYIKVSKKDKQQCKEVIVQIQKILLDQGITKLLFDLLHHPNDDITYQVIACFKVLLYLGNAEAQQMIASYVTQKDQRLIIIVHQILRNAHTSTKMSTGKEALLSTRQRVIDHRVTIALDVIAFLCDGQQRDMQNTLRDEQIFNESSIVNQTAFLLLGIVDHLNEEEDAIVVAQSAIQALVEMCAGNYENQVIAFRGQVITSVNVILATKDKVREKKLYELQCSSIELTEVLLEEIDENSAALACCITKCFDVKTLLKRMFDFWQSPLHFSYEQISKDLCRAYHVLKRIADYKEISVDALVEYDRNAESKTNNFNKLFDDKIAEAKRMWRNCSAWSNRVEIVYKSPNGNEILSRAYFPHDPHMDFNEKEKEMLLLNIKRRTPQEKLIDLFKWTKELKSSSDRKINIREKCKLKIFHLILQTSTVRSICLVLLTILLNIFVLFTLEPPSDYNMLDGICEDNQTVKETCANISSLYFRPVFYPEVPGWYNKVHYTLGSLHLLLSLLMVISYFYKNYHRLHFEIYFVKGQIYKCKKWVMRRKMLYKLLTKVNDTCLHGKIYVTRPESAKYYGISVLSFQPLYRLFFAILSMLGLWNGYFYCGCMIYPFLGSNVMLYIIEALKRSALQLLTVFLLCIVFIYIYAVFSFAMIQNYFSEDKDQFCHTVFQCFITILRIGLLNTLGSALDVRPSEEYQPNFSLVGARAVYDIVFFILVTILGLNLVIAILVDRFSDMRGEKDKVVEDNKSRCFICSIGKDAFDTYCGSKAFQRHLDEDHNVWKYIQFILYLQSLYHNDLNAIEKYVLNQVKDDCIDFFPISKTRILQFKK